MLFFRILILCLIFYFFGLEIATVIFMSWLVLVFINSLHCSYEREDFETDILIFLRLAAISVTRKSKWVTEDEIKDYVLKEHKIRGPANRSSARKYINHEVTKLVESGDVERQKVLVELLSMRKNIPKYGYETAYAIKNISGGVDGEQRKRW